ncbi:extracellular solute-binding protein [Lederbergia wuyishanensis]|uniref:Aldouronate transport system substrate-binding protein n=1 Tax=Lederbergia wuyishanensis TaxID=1347903 RepID=A0ABU0D977_9BACI|nr:extracellular solute-binding protein [Lederbergia wuyishanensis]MCJ8009418.1 extracellular solute-binding protein [Lederbergia wuyishanensis]MDQ0344973.1 putative aldouronate transport system substrate-binding protein [Lederbergia wuyishanensis]
MSPIHKVENVKRKAPKSVFLLLLMMTMSLSSCSAKGESMPSNTEDSKVKLEINQEGFPIVNGELSLTMFGPNVGVSKWEDMKYFIEMEKKTNIHFNFITPPNESFETQKKLLFASRDLPDIFYASSLSNSEITKYSKQGLLIPLENLIEQYAPNIQRMFEELPDVKKSITALDGHIYALPSVDRSLPWNYSPLWYNGSFLKALEVKKLPETTEELFELLTRMKNEDPNGDGEQDEIPLTAVKLSDINQWFMGFFGIVSPAQGVYEDKVQYGALKPEYREYLIYMNRLWENELLDHETFSQSHEQKLLKGNNNRVGLYSSWGPGALLGMEDNTANPMMQPVSSPNVKKPVIPISPGQSVGQFAITNVNPYPEATIRWIDYSYSPEGSIFLHSLYEGDIWEWADRENGIRRYISGFPQDYRGTLTPNYGINVPHWTQIEYAKSFKSEFSEFNYAETDKKIIAYGQVPFPNVFLTAEELDQIAGITADLNTYVEDMEMKFITGREPISMWDSYVQTLKEIGVDKLVDVYQTAYDRYESIK